MPTYIRVKDLPNSASSLNADDYIMLSGSIAGARKIQKADFLSTVADEFNNSPSTYKLATLDASNKVDSSQWPASAFSYQGTWAASSNTPTLANGSGTAGYTYYASDAGSVNFGAGAISFTAGDAVVYDGSIWQKVPAVANILDGAATAEQGRTTLDVNSTAQDAEANGTKLVGPEMHFDGTSYMEFAANPALTPTTGSGATRQDTAFSFGTWLKLNDDYDLSIGQYGTSAANRGWLLYMDSSSSPKFKFAMEDGSSNEMRVTSSDDYFVSGQWTHVAVTCTALSAASARQDDIKIYVNGKEISTTNFNVGYTGLTYSATQPLVIGKRSNTLSAFSQRDFKFFNKALSASEVKTLCLSGQLPESFAESTGRSLGAIDETSGLASWSGAGSIVPANLTETANTTVGGRANVLKEEATASGGGVTTRFYIASAFDMGKRVRIEFDYYLPSSNATIDKLEVFFTSGSTLAGLTVTDTWTRASIEAVVGPTSTLQFALYDGGSFNPTAGDFIALDNFAITQIGSVLDARAEQFDTSTGKLYDLSGNDFVGTQSGGVSLLGRKMPIYETGTWKPTITFGGGITGITYSAQEGNYTRIGNQVTVHGSITLANKGSDSGSMRIAGLPYTSITTTGSYQSAVIGLSANWDASVTETPALVVQSASTQLLGTVALSGSELQATHFSNTTTIRFSGTYQIQ